MDPTPFASFFFVMSKRSACMPLLQRHARVHLRQGAAAAAAVRVPTKPPSRSVTAEVQAIRSAFTRAHRPIEAQRAAPSPVDDRRWVFIVHGHAEGAKHKVRAGWSR
jgi:hypothetical protein